MTRAVIRHISTDHKGRAVVLMVLDGTDVDLMGALENGSAPIELMTSAQIAAEAQAPAPQHQPARTQKGGALCRWLHARCREQMFQKFLGAKYGRNANTPETALEAVKSLLQFGSSVRLDNDDTLGTRFKTEIMQEYAQWHSKR